MTDLLNAAQSPRCLLVERAVELSSRADGLAREVEALRSGAKALMAAAASLADSPPAQTEAMQPAVPAGRRVILRPMVNGRVRYKGGMVWHERIGADLNGWDRPRRRLVAVEDAELSLPIVVEMPEGVPVPPFRLRAYEGDDRRWSADRGKIDPEDIRRQLRARGTNLSRVAASLGIAESETFAAVRGIGSAPIKLFRVVANELSLPFTQVWGCPDPYMEKRAT
jgi:hypothetical protein